MEAQTLHRGRLNLAFQAQDEAAVDASTPPGSPQVPRATVRPACAPITRAITQPSRKDPDGNNIEGVFHGPAKRSAEAVLITF